MTKAIEDRWSKHYGIGEDPDLIPDKPDEGLESYLLSRCMLYCKDLSLEAWHDYSRKKNRAGWGDIFVFLPKANILLVELKSATGRLEPEQKEKRTRLSYRGHIVHVGRSFEWFKALVDRRVREIEGKPERG